MECGPLVPCRHQLLTRSRNMRRFAFRRPLIALVVLVGMLAQGTWALAGTTGVLNGTVVAIEGNVPLAGVNVTVSSPSQVASTTTDAQGHFTFVSLAPDAYTVSAEKEGYQSISRTGIAVFADNTHTLSLSLLKIIGKVTTRATGALVKPGTTADVYSVNVSTQQAVKGLGGGGSIDQAYSAIASVPGVYVPAGANGWNQTVNIRGGDYDQIGYEFDGVPVNRSFDNYPAVTASALGQQELQVYTGAAPANAEATGLSGFINQVIKTGTYPGFAGADIGVGAPSFYHKLNFEIGGANPSRLFSYYIGIGGVDQDFRVYDQSNGSSLSSRYGTPFDLFPCPGTPGTAVGAGNALNGNFTGCYAASGASPSLAFVNVGPGGYQLGPFNAGTFPAHITDRENVFNVHFGIPHRKDAGRDDVQVLYDVASLWTWFYNSPSDWSQTQLLAANPGGILRAGSPLAFPGPSLQYNGQAGTFLPSNFPSLMTAYGYPTADTNTGGVVPSTRRDASQNDQAIFKLQYQHNIGSSAYVRLYGYTFYSDWLLNGPNSNGGFGIGQPLDYELLTHTRGVSGTFADQINAKHLLEVDASAVHSTVVRFNNGQANVSPSAPFAYLVDSTSPANGICYSLNGAGPAFPTSCYNTSSSHTNPVTTVKFNSPGTAAALPGGATCGGNPCAFYVASTGQSGTLNQVRPTFYAFSVQDQWKPSNQLLFNLGLRWQNYRFAGAATDTGARPFWFNAWNASECISATPGSAPFLNPAISTSGAAPGAPCPSGTGPATLTNSAADYSYSSLEPRLGITYTMNPLNVVRFSYGKYSQPADSAAEQYNVAQQNLPGFLGPTFMPFGFNQPGHDIPPEFSYNADLSWEHQLKGTDWSWKLTPFWRYTTGEQTSFWINPKTFFVSVIPVGNLKSQGVELALQKGDFNRDGWSGSFAFTYTYTTVNYTNLRNGGTPLSPINTDIKTYNAYTSFCATHTTDPRCGLPTNGAAAAACYTSAGAPDPACAAGDVANPYWNAPVQGLLSLNGPYFPTDTVVSTLGLNFFDPYGVPYTSTLVLNYKRGKWRFTPSFQFVAGSRYGTPETTPGIDPASGCSALPGSTTGDPRYPYGAAGGAPYDATSCASGITIPNQFTQQFDNTGAFRNPSQLLGHLQIGYEVSPRMTLQLTMTNIINTCFGGSKEPWNFGNNKVCAYIPTSIVGEDSPAGNFYNPGASFQSLVAYPYIPFFGVPNNDVNGGYMAPFSAFLDVILKM
ncbi:hypothetical protein EPN42_09155 [bacterium]|nr:MAG: hypothetical protein EPN42_09155 [bacterium]